MASTYSGRVLGARTATAQRWVTLLVISVVAGLLLAGMLLPIVGGVGLLARTGANDFEALPSDLRISALPQASRILAADGSTIAKFYFQDRETVPLSAVPDVMQRAIIATEDVRFYEHHGIDWRGAIRALLHNGEAGTVQQGGSTLTQQYVKNVLIERAEANGNAKAAAAAHADTLTRKLREARYALALEQRYSKAQILQGYLNIAYFGDGAYGVGTAARHYFGESVRKLTLAQSAVLAGLVQSPEVYDPALHPKAARQRRAVVLGQMLKYNFITERQYKKAMRTRIKLDLTRQGNGCEASQYPYFCDYVQHVILQSPEFGKTVADRQRLLLQGGLTIQTTIEPQVQDAADAAIHNYVHPHEPSGVAGAEAVVQPGTGKVLAISVSRPYGQDQSKGENTIDYAVDQKYGGGVGFSPGSTFKLFVLAAALKEGIPLNTTINSPPQVHVSGFTDCSGNDVGSWTVSNAEPTEGGNFNLITGTWESVNTFYAQLEQRTGLCMPIHLAEAMGVHPSTGGDIPAYPVFTLGAAGGYSSLDMANAYATIAAHGTYCNPIAITHVTDQDGRSLPIPQSHCQQVVSPGLADTITSILHGVLTQNGATGAGVGEPGRPAAAKTGTAENNKASNFAGFVPQMASFVWVGNPERQGKDYTLNHLTIGGRPYGEVFGATIAGPIWRETMTAALQGKPVIPLPKADLQFVNGKKKTVPDVRGLTVSNAQRTLQHAGFKPVVGSQVDSLFPAGTVAYTSPSGGSDVPPHATVTIYVSNGHAPPVTQSPSPPPTKQPPPGQQTPPSSPAPSPTCSKLHGHCP